LDVVSRTATSAAVLALFFSALLSIYHLIICAGLLLLNRLYSNKPARISRRGGLAPLLLPIGYVFLPFSIGYLAISDKITSSSLLVLAGLYLHFLARIILKDYRDVKGDKAFGKKTFLLNRGNLAVCVVSGLSLFASTALLFYGAGEWLGAFAYSLVILLFLGIGLLGRLSRTPSWKWQKPILAAFGRSMTGVTACLIFGLLFTIEPISEGTKALLAFLLVIVYVWSARAALEYNIK
jgi:4-hydroxybenzoate polyprenyltransferase